jgi:hypothetical protein
MNTKNKIKAFTLIEIMLWILIVSWILMVAFDAVSKVSFWKIKLIDSSNIEKETFFFAQRLYETIKKWWTIDYEEYWNRKVVWNTTYQSGHYNLETWFWNFWRDWSNTDNSNVWTNTFWDWFYYCRSWNWTQLWTNWCYNNSNLNDSNWNDTPDWKNYSWNPQRYGEYSFQFIDYNSNADNDLWDEDNDSNNSIIWDDDDEFLWNWPTVFTSWVDVKELYLISADKKHRTLLRLNYVLDPQRPTWSSCTTSDAWKTYTWTWCLWRIEILKLYWLDWWMDHSNSSTDSDGTQYDWVIDTWVIDKDFAGKSDYSSVIVAWSDGKNYWLPLFSDNVNVKSFKVYPYPNIDIDKAWKYSSSGTNFAPYVRLEIVLSPSWKVKKRIKWRVPEFKYSTTISLTDVYSR